MTTKSNPGDDMQLLEAAARAAGIEVVTHGDISKGCIATGWNPLVSDADAFRLAVKMKLMVSIEERFTGAITNEAEEYTENHRGDACAATRRAIVRAAAAIGAAK